MTDREFWLLVREALLLFVDAIERRYAIRRTCELRKLAKEAPQNPTIIPEVSV